MTFDDLAHVTVIDPEKGHGACIYLSAHTCLTDISKMITALRPGSILVAHVYGVGGGSRGDGREGPTCDWRFKVPPRARNLGRYGDSPDMQDMGAVGGGFGGSD
jgi:hypothetical protein